MATAGARAAVPAGAVAVTIAVGPAWLQLGSYDRQNAAAIAAQRRADATQGANVDRLIALIKANGGGRVYVGMPSNWGIGFMVGQVPVFKYLDSRDIDEVGYTLRTASLMTDPEYYFDEGDPGDYRLFGIHYLVVPAGYLPPVSARLTMRSGQYWLWTVDPGGYVNVGRIVGELAANRTDVGRRSVALLRSGLTQAGDYLRLAYGEATGSQGSIATVPSAPRQPPAGAVSAETDSLAGGEAVGERNDARARRRRPQRLAGPGLDRDGRRAPAAGAGDRTCARRRRRARGHPHGRVPLSRGRGL